MVIRITIPTSTWYNLRSICVQNFNNFVLVASSQGTTWLWVQFFQPSSGLYQPNPNHSWENFFIANSTQLPTILHKYGKNYLAGRTQPISEMKIWDPNQPNAVYGWTQPMTCLCLNLQRYMEVNCFKSVFAIIFEKASYAWWCGDVKLLYFRCWAVSKLFKLTTLTVTVSDVCLEAEASPRGRLEAAQLQPRLRLHVLMTRLGLASARGYCLCLASVSCLLPRLDSRHQNL